MGRTPADRRWRAVVLCILTMLLSAGLDQLGLFRVAELKTEDFRYRTRGTRPVDPRLRLVLIDEKTVRSYPTVPIERSQHAVLLSGLARAGVSAVGFDLLFTDPDLGPYDKLLGQIPGSYGIPTALACHFTGSLMLGVEAVTAPLDPLFVQRTYSSDRPEAPAPLYLGRAIDLPIEVMLQRQVELGHVTFFEEDDGSIRRVPLVIRRGDRGVPTLALSVWLAAQGYSSENVFLHEAVPDLRSADGDSVLISFNENAVHEVNYAGDVDVFAASSMSYIDVVNLVRAASGAGGSSPNVQAKAQLEEKFEDTIVLVGLTATGSYMLDEAVTPFSGSRPLLYTHANLLNDLLGRTHIRRVPSSAETLVTALLLLVGLYWGAQLPVVRWLLASALVLVSVFALAQIVFATSSIMLHLVRPMFTLAAGYLTIGALTFVGQERERQIMRRTFERYVSQDLLEDVIKNAGHISLGGDLRLATVVFVDIRGFTAWTRSLEPGVLVDELNSFLSEMVEVVFEWQGSVNKFLGDAVLAVFGAPLQGNDDAVRAVRAARAMQSRLETHNQRRVAEDKPAIRMGIGIATGPVVAGNVGSSQRLEYTVIGNAVNLSARLQALSRDGQILVDAPTKWAIQDESNEVELKSIGQHQLKGIEEPLEVFEVRARNGAIRSK